MLKFRVSAELQMGIGARTIAAGRDWGRSTRCGSGRRRGRAGECMPWAAKKKIARCDGAGQVLVVCGRPPLFGCHATFESVFETGQKRGDGTDGHCCCRYCVG